MFRWMYADILSSPTSGVRSMLIIYWLVAGDMSAVTNHKTEFKMISSFIKFITNNLSTEFWIQGY
jgi:hypothetical protein